MKRDTNNKTSDHFMDYRIHFSKDLFYRIFTQSMGEKRAVYAEEQAKPSGLEFNITLCRQIYLLL